MPLRAISKSININAFEYDESSWKEFKKTYKSLDLNLPCCNATAIPKTSKLGNFFFAHKNRNECKSKPESAEHIYLKSIIAKAASNAGWSVITEHSGQSKDGDEWIADVYCIKGNATVALEVQLSYITNEMLELRTERYLNSGVRVAWFLSNIKFNINYLYPSKRMPMFLVGNFNCDETPLISPFDLTIEEFIFSLLNKKIQWKSTPRENEILFLEDACWRCKKEVKQVYGYSIDVYREVAKTVPNASTVLLQLLDLIKNKDLNEFGLNSIGRFDELKGNAPGFPHCNVCIHCGAPQNNHYLMEKLKTCEHPVGSQTIHSYSELNGEWILIKDPSTKVL